MGERAAGVRADRPRLLLEGAKSLSYAGNMLAKRLAEERGFHEALLVAPDGRVLEAQTAAFFWVTHPRSALYPASFRGHPELDLARDSAEPRSGGGAPVPSCDALHASRGLPGGHGPGEIHPVGVIESGPSTRCRPVTRQVSELFGSDVAGRHRRAGRRPSEVPHPRPPRGRPRSDRAAGRGDSLQPSKIPCAASAASKIGRADVYLSAFWTIRLTPARSASPDLGSRQVDEVRRRVGSHGDVVAARVGGGGKGRPHGGSDPPPQLRESVGDRPRQALTQILQAAEAGQLRFRRLFRPCPVLECGQKAGSRGGWLRVHLPGSVDMRTPAQPSLISSESCVG